MPLQSYHQHSHNLLPAAATLAEKLLSPAPEATLFSLICHMSIAQAFLVTTKQGCLKKNNNISMLILFTWIKVIPQAPELGDQRSQQALTQMLWSCATSASRAAAGRENVMSPCLSLSVGLRKKLSGLKYSFILVYLFTYLLIAKFSKNFDLSAV